MKATTMGWSPYFCELTGPVTGSKSVALRKASRGDTYIFVTFSA